MKLIVVKYKYKYKYKYNHVADVPIPEEPVVGLDSVLFSACGQVLNMKYNVYHYKMIILWLYYTGCFFTLGLPLKVQSTEKLI